MKIDFKFILIIVHALFVVHQTNGARILSLFPTPSKSHTILGLKLAEGLVKRGHHVTFVTPYKADPMANLTLIEMKSINEYKERIAAEAFKQTGFFSMFKGLLAFTKGVSELFWEDPNIQKIIRDKPKYDLVIVINFFNDAMLSFGQHLGAPTIVFSCIGSTSFTNTYVANPTMVYSRNALLDLQTDTFFGRLSTVAGNVMMGVLGYQANKMNQEFLDKYLPDSPPIGELQKKISLVLVNSHVSIEPARPYVPNMVQIGGFHVQDTKPLPEEFKTFLDGAKNGAILFTLGSNVKLELIGEKQREAIFKVLGEMAPMRVIFKSNLEHENVPKNIMVKKWVPQSDILAHPNIKLFISHGGLGGNTESVYHGVPILGMPFIGDQRMNMNEAQSAGYATVVNHEEITEELFRGKILEMLNNPKYTQSVKRRSALMREMPVSPMQTAAFWIEHVIKFGGGEHLKNAGMNLTWYQLYMVDIYVFVTVLLVLLAVIHFYIVKLSLRILKRLFGKSNSKKDGKKVKKS